VAGAGSMVRRKHMNGTGGWMSFCVIFRRILRRMIFAEVCLPVRFGAKTRDVGIDRTFVPVHICFNL